MKNVPEVIIFTSQQITGESLCTLYTKGKQLYDDEQSDGSH